MMTMSAGEHALRVEPDETDGQAVLRHLSAAGEPIGEPITVNWALLMHGTPFNHEGGAFRVSDVTIRPDSPAADQTLSTNATFWNSQGHLIETTFRWSVNGTVLADQRERTLAPEHFQQGDHVEVMYTIYNGIDAASGTASVVIGGK